MERNDTKSAPAHSLLDPPSKSKRRRDALSVLELASDLAALKDSALRQLPISPEALEAITGINRIKARVARKRQLHYAAKRLRDEDLDAIRAALNDPGHSKAQQVRLSQWSDYLMQHGQPAVEQLIALAPESNRQTLRQAVLSAQRLPAEESTEGQPHDAAHSLILRAIRQQPGCQSLPAPPTADSD